MAKHIRKKTPVGKKRVLNPHFQRKGPKGVVLIEAIPVHDEEELRLVFESASSPWPQGVWMITDQGIELNGEICKSIRIWQQNAPPEVRFRCHSKDGILTLYNVWDSGRGLGSESQAMTSGMLVEELPNGYRYRCNDIGLEPDFRKLVFRIERSSKDH